ncbi:MAG: MarR family transcriptional regulator [Arenibacter latericius]|nr:MarR family transcriptional regulator [Arenibacter latericius]
MNISEEKKQLIEQIGIGFGDRMGVSPLAARIYGLLTLSSYDGLTFEEVREALGSSKSSTSINLNVLTQLNFVEYYTRPGDRKRYFKVSKSFQKKYLMQYAQTLNSEAELISKINSYNLEHYPEKFVNEKSMGTLMEEYIKAQHKLVETTLKKMTAFLEGQD